MFVALGGLGVGVLGQWVTDHVERALTSHFFRRRIQYFSGFFLTRSLSSHFYLWCKFHRKNRKFLFAFKTFFEET